MNIVWESVRAGISLVVLSLFWSACQHDGGPTAPSLAVKGNTKGAGGQMPAYYDGELFTINSTELPEAGAASLIGHNGSVNEIYATNDLDEEQDFIPVIDAIQGEGFNPLW